ncbi:MAG: UDP-N-acetylmuramoyl-tripeptide--D-alanyl-D-alanine ligase [Kiritimatiellaceae bacterium]|nr:UDP-N-acetylmuramoyl-tripeptide--D-alanyl-D-alanine ligase [Kiritimatiellaceae bacterium]
MYTAPEFSDWVCKPWKHDDSSFQGLEIAGLSHDTRTLQKGDVYIAIRGENYDGHDFVEQAVEKGAVGVIVEREFPALGKPQLIVSNALEALWLIAAGARSTWAGTVIGITGSAGKTTVKEMVAAVLSQKGAVAKTRGNWNNDIGLPLSMIAAERTADFFVFELGMNHPGEIDPLASLLRPDWALITNIGKAHIEFFQGLEPAVSGDGFFARAMEGIANEKAAILKHAEHAVLNQDSEWFDRLNATFDGTPVHLTEQEFSIAQPGEYMRLNTRFAATIGLELGLTREAVQAGLDTFVSVPMRWQQVQKDGVLFINDAYNANPLSMRAALSTFFEMECNGRKWVVLGGMHELGEATEKEHCSLGEFIDTLLFDRVLTVGELGAKIVCRGELGLEKSAAVERLREQLQAGDIVLLKASRSERLETILEEFNTEF